ncbi:hypothetical protein AVEN_172478-1 [Araneus ventricosus]|uniref:Gustatory receptor n=1 Tax=Araneus ventricosus TaxID=182803 RepID=A0A4Y2DQ93_ARAVE|nr:hypothetical protein AVEN_172478-1 [Araneus ventricosus]
MKQRLSLEMQPDIQALFTPVFLAMRLMGHYPLGINVGRRFSVPTFIFFLFGIYFMAALSYRLISIPIFYSYHIALIIHGILELIAYISVVCKLREMANTVQTLKTLQEKLPYMPTLKSEYRCFIWFFIINVLLLIAILANCWIRVSVDGGFKQLAITYFFVIDEMTAFWHVMTKIAMVAIICLSQVIPTFSLLFYMLSCIVFKNLCYGFKKSLKGEKNMQSCVQLHTICKDLAYAISDFNSKINFFIFLMYLGLCMKTLRCIQALYFNFSMSTLTYNGPLICHTMTSFIAVTIPASQVHTAFEKISEEVDSMKYRNVTFEKKCLFILKLKNTRAALTLWDVFDINKNMLLSTLGFIFSYSAILYEIDKSRFTDLNTSFKESLR